MNSSHDDPNAGLDNEESKSQRKRRMTELQDIGEQLLTLNERQLSQIELPDRLRAALHEYQRLPNRHEARRRQRQFIGKLMRGSDHETIRQSLERLLAPSQEQTRRSQEIERWGQRLLDGDEDDIQAFLERYPTAERQPLRAVVRRYQAVQAQDVDTAGRDSAGSADTKPGPSGEAELSAAITRSDDSPPAEAVTPASSDMITARRRLLDYIKSCIQL